MSRLSAFGPSTSLRTGFRLSEKRGSPRILLPLFAAGLVACTPEVRPDGRPQCEIDGTCSTGEDGGPGDGGPDAGPADGGPADGGSACADPCSGTTPVCDEFSGTCVRCTPGRGCASGTFCDAAVPGGRCVSCVGDGQCAWPAPKCDTAAGVCVGCRDDVDCSGDTPVCDPGPKRCVHCTADRGCSGDRPACDLTVVGGLCVPCVDDSTCSGATPVCDTSTATCVGCVGPSDCSTAAPVCDPVSRRCVVCTAVQGCQGTTPVCDTTVSGGRCLGCRGAGDCRTEQPVCDPVSHACVECSGDGQCPSARPVCDASQRCVVCTSARGCPSDRPLCDASGAVTRCVECRGSGDCGGTTRVCAVAEGTCVGCLGDTNCDSGHPVCDTASRRCVVCTATRGCSPGTSCDLSVPGGRCAGCTSDAQCAAPTPRCDPATLRCVACLSNAGCADPTPICGADRVCRGCVSGSECGAGATCQDGVCQPSPDNCNTAETLTFSSGATSLSFAADLAGTHDDLDGSCNLAARGPDIVYRLVLPGPSDVTITAARAAGSSANPVLYVRTFAHCASGPDLACQDTPASAGAPETVRLVNRSGELAVVVESYGLTSGAVDVTVTIAPATVPPTNDECNHAEALVFAPDGTAHASGNTALATNSQMPGDLVPTCSSTAADSGRDVVYTYTLLHPSDVAIRVTPTGSPATLVPVVYLRSPGHCDSLSDADELACENPGDPVPILMDLRNQPAGVYPLWVDGRVDTVGRFDVDVALSSPTLPAANDDCAHARWLAFTNGAATETGDTSVATNGNSSGDEAPTCSQSARQTGRDTVYAFHLDATRDVTARVVPTGTPTTLAPAVYLRPLASCDSGAAASQLACAATSDAVAVSARARNLAPGDHAVWVDSVGGYPGRYRLEVTQSAPTPPPANDVCAGMQTVAFDSTGQAQVSGDTGDAANSTAAGDTAPTCSQSARQSGQDLVYGLNPGTATAMTVVVVPTDGSALAPVLYVRAPGQCASGDPMSELACDLSGAAGVPVDATLQALPGGLLPVWVDGSGDTSGAFVLHARAGAPPNDTCAGARTIVPGAGPIVDSTALAQNDFSGALLLSAACSSQMTSDRFPARDLVFAFTASSAGTVHASVRPTADYDVALLRLEGSCAPASCVQAVDPGSDGDPERMSFSVTAGQTYWLVVDGYRSDDAGGFVLTVE